MTRSSKISQEIWRWMPSEGRKASTVGCRAAAIGNHHKLAGHGPPANQDSVKVLLRGIRGTPSARQRQGDRKAGRTASQPRHAARLRAPGDLCREHRARRGEDLA